MMLGTGHNRVAMAFITLEVDTSNLDKVTKMTMDEAIASDPGLRMDKSCRIVWPVRSEHVCGGICVNGCRCRGGQTVRVDQ